MKAHKSLPILSFANATDQGIVVTDLEHTYHLQDAQPEGDYPEYGSLIPAADKAESVVVLDPKLLMKALKVVGDESQVRLELHGELKPVVLRADREGVSFTGVVMPQKS